MAIDKIAGFNIGASEPVDNRIVLTKAEMKLRGTGPAYPMPDVYFAVCKEDGNVYVYNKENTEDSETGKFRVYSSSNDLSAKYYEEDKTIELFGFK